MSKKINLKSKYLGLSNKWPISFQNYGNITFIFSKYFINIFLFSNILEKKLILSQNMFFSNLEFFIFNNFFKININLIYLRQFKLEKILTFLLNLEKILLLNFSSLMPKIFVYFEKKSFFQSIFLKNYISYLVNNLNYSPKKIFNFLIPLFKNMLHIKKLSFSNKGLKIIKLQGIKIQLKGRYELTKNSMSKLIFFKAGKVGSMSLNTKIEFLNKTIYTKLGKSSMKIWFFYLFEKK